MSYIYHGKKGWIKQPNRNFKTWESGLCMVQEQYICRADDVDYSAFQLGDPIENSEPCIDGAFIYPEPSFQNLGNGFIQATVTAYGRINTTGTQTSISSAFQIPVYAQKGQFSCTGSSCNFFLYAGVASSLPMDYIGIVIPLPTLKIVLPENQFPQIDSILKNIPIYDTNGNNITNQLYYVSDFLNGNYSVGTNNPPIRFTDAEYHAYPVNYFGSPLEQARHPYVTPGFSGSKIPLEITHSSINSTNYGKFTEYIIPITNVSVNQMNTGLINFGAFYEKAAPTIIGFGAISGLSTTTIRLATLSTSSNFYGANLNVATRLEIEVDGVTYNILGGLGKITISLSAGDYTVKYRAYNDYGMFDFQEEITVP